MLFESVVCVRVVVVESCLVYVSVMLKLILIYFDFCLKKICVLVVDFMDELCKLVVDMLEIMYDVSGIGLVVVQIGVLDCLIVMDCIKEGDLEFLIMFNFEVLVFLDDINVYEEGCFLILD